MGQRSLGLMCLSFGLPFRPIWHHLVHQIRCFFLVGYLKGYLTNEVAQDLFSANTKSKSFNFSFFNLPALPCPCLVPIFHCSTFCPSKRKRMQCSLYWKNTSTAISFFFLPNHPFTKKKRKTTKKKKFSIREKFSSCKQIA